MNKSNVIELSGRVPDADLLTEMLRSGAQRLIQEAVEVEVQALLAQYSDLRTAAGHAGVVRNGYLPERDLQTSLGPVTVKNPSAPSPTPSSGMFMPRDFSFNRTSRQL